MTPHRSSGPRPVAPTVRANPHVQCRREAKKPPARPPVTSRDHTRNWPAWTDDVAYRCSLPPAESAIVAAIDRMGRPVTAGELSTYSSAVRRLDRRARDGALLNLVRRGLIECREARRPSPLLKASDHRSLTFFGFPEHFESTREAL